MRSKSVAALDRADRAPTLVSDQHELCRRRSGTVEPARCWCLRAPTGLERDRAGGRERPIWRWLWMLEAHATRPRSPEPGVRCRRPGWIHPERPVSRTTWSIGPYCVVSDADSVLEAGVRLHGPARRGRSGRATSVRDVRAPFPMVVLYDRTRCSGLRGGRSTPASSSAPTASGTPRHSEGALQGPPGRPGRSSRTDVEIGAGSTVDRGDAPRDACRSRERRSTTW